MGEAKRKAQRLGDAPIEPEYEMKMQALGATIDEVFNGPEASQQEVPGDRAVGFCLMVFNTGEGPGRCNFLSNCVREDVIVLLKEQLARFQGQPEIEGRA